MATWPSILPAPRMSGYRLAPIDPAIRTQMEGANTRVRRRSRVRTDRVTCTLRLTDDQLFYFRQFFDDPTGANGGAAWFGIDLITGSDLAGIVTVEAVFASMWEAEYAGHNKWLVTMPLEVRYA
ncbi:hypothetical protein [Desulfobulbus elongatus]|uniref:hypothetical protein n=1 Tax=Desulfobulbus elongatus TaxID=53332 RepID=UPI00048881CD|nr:hypothetical protein [Desulfobulbus elongatus]